VLLFYVDECGDAKPWTNGAVNESSDYLVLSAVGFADTTRENVAQAMQDLRDKFLPDVIATQPWEHGELKGRYIAQASRAASQGMMPRRASLQSAFSSQDRGEEFLASLGSIFDRFRPLIFVAVVDKARLADQERDLDPLGAAYALLHTRVAQVLGSVVSGEGAIFVADQQVEHERYFRDGRMRDARATMAARLHREPPFDRLMDKPLWIDTGLSTWDREIIQIADIVAYSTYELMKRGSRPSERYYLWDSIRPWLAQNWSQRTPNGAGLSIFPRPRDGHYPQV
jgi:hypothetical protein